MKLFNYCGARQLLTSWHQGGRLSHQCEILRLLLGYWQWDVPNCPLLLASRNSRALPLVPAGSTVEYSWAHSFLQKRISQPGCPLLTCLILLDEVTDPYQRPSLSHPHFCIVAAEEQKAGRESFPSILEHWQQGPSRDSKAPITGPSQASNQTQPKCPPLPRRGTSHSASFARFCSSFWLSDYPFPWRDLFRLPLSGSFTRPTERVGHPYSSRKLSNWVLWFRKTSAGRCWTQPVQKQLDNWD